MLIPKTVNDLPHPLTEGAKLDLVSTEANILAYAYGKGKVFKFNCSNPKDLCSGTEWELLDTLKGELVKSSFSEKAVKIKKNLPTVLTLLSKNSCFVKTGGRFFSNFAAFS